MFINVICELLMNLIDCNDFVTLITASIRIEFTCRELNSYNLYDFPHDRYTANNCRLEDRVPGICHTLSEPQQKTTHLRVGSIRRPGPFRSNVFPSSEGNSRIKVFKN